MSKATYFLLAEALVIILIAAIKFKSFKSFYECFFSFLFSGYYVFWKRLWNEHFNRSMQFVVFLFISGIFTVINILVFKYLIK
jgi:hypothetical protein